MEKKKLLILGSDYGTLDTVHEAHKMGLHVIVTDTMATSPARVAADETWNISTTDIDALAERCRKEGIAGVVYGASDFNINNGRKLCKLLGLPHYCPDDKAWETACNKAVFKSLCNEVGAPVATGYQLSDSLSREELDKIKYPVVVKPVDKSGNRGMSYCSNETELLKAYKEAREISDNPVIIVERQLHGPEYCVNYVIANGEARLLYFSSEHNEPGYPHNMYSIIDTTSSNLKKYLETTNEKVIDVFKAAGCKDGIAWVETILDSDGNFYLLEMGHRYGGEMTYVPYRDVSGFNSIRFMIEIALGIKHSEKDLPKPLDHAYKEIATSYFLFSKEASEIGRLEGLDEIGKLPNVYVDFPKGVGAPTRYRASLGIIRIFSKDVEELCETIKFINDHLIVTDKKGDNLIVYFTDFGALRDEYHKGLEEMAE
jgi:biotin carboxylase